MQQMLKTMRESSFESDLLPKSEGEKMFQSLLDGQYAKLRETASEFEAIFVQQMLKTMRESSFESDLLTSSEGEKMFRSLLDEQYARLSAKSGSLGLGEMIYQQLKSNLDK